jgi:hypothetical protein
MDFKHIKVLFYALFALDILAGAAVARFLSVLHGIITCAVLLILNVTVFAIILKIQKIKERANGHKKKSGTL